MENPEFFQGGYCNAQFTPEKRLSDSKNGDHFIIDDLLDFPNDDGTVTDATVGSFDPVMTGNSTDSSTTTVVDTSCNSSFSGRTEENHFASDNSGGCRNFSDSQFSGELCVPYDDLAELEWLSNFVEESFSSEDLQKLQLIQGMKAPADAASGTHQYRFQPEATGNARILNAEMTVPAKARSKRSRAAPGNWTSRLSVVAPTPPAAKALTAISSSSDSEIATGKEIVKVPAKKKESSDNAANGEGRKCLHCATDKTPQWRTGPMGPKTLCNACGVRYKSGRLVPEYRPAASPTFVLTKHSNSHRKVLELRRQKEMLRAQQHQQQRFLHPNMMFDVSNSDDYLIHQHIGPDFRQLI